MGGSGTIQEIMEHVIAIAEFSEEQQSILHKGGPGTESGYRLAWARIYLKKVTALENSQRGVWAITSYGRTLTERDMRVIPTKVRAMSPPKSRTSRSIQGMMADDPTVSEEIPTASLMAQRLQVPRHVGLYTPNWRHMRYRFR